MRLSVQEAANLLNVSTKTIYRWAGEGRIPGYRVNRQYRFDRTELVEWATGQRLAVNPAFRPDPDHTEEPIPSFAQAVEWGGVHYRVEGATRDEALRNAVTALRLVDDSDLLTQALIAREELAPTAVGDGFAIPHLRKPLRFEIRRPVVSVCFLDHPIEWNAPDRQPVSVLLVVVGPTIRSVLQLHALAWFALREPGFRAILGAHGPREAILAEARRVSEALRHPSGDPA